MPDLELFARIGLALAIGLLIGIERGWQEREGAEGSRVAGIRTNALIGLLGGIWGALTPMTGGISLGLAGLAVAGAMGLFEWRQSQGDRNVSATGFIAGLLAFALGAYAVLGNMMVAGAAAVAATFVLYERQALHEFLKRMSWIELRSALLLLVMTFVLLPLLPDRAMGPWNALNPHEIWLLIILAAALSYGGYLAIKLAGEHKGVLFGGAAGGLVSSTTVTWTFAQRAMRTTGKSVNFESGIVASWTVSLLRMTVIAVILAPPLWLTLVPAAFAAAGVLAMATGFFYRRAATDGEGIPLEDPFDVSAILKLGAVLVVVLIASKGLQAQLGEGGLFALAWISGFADVDPMTLAMSREAGSTVSFHEATLLILSAAAANGVAKCVLSAVFGSWRFALPLTLAAVAAAGAAALMLYATAALS